MSASSPWKRWGYYLPDVEPSSQGEYGQLYKMHDMTFSEDDGTWHVGQCYEEANTKTVICTKCGSRLFNVGEGSYLTAIRCAVCRWELVFHDG